MVAYRWQLRKGGKKMRCPQCGQMRFVPFESVATGELAGAEYGRCDREQNCGYFRYPNGVETPTPIARQVAEEQPIRFYPAAVKTDIRTNLFDYVSAAVGVGAALRAWQTYHVGKDGNRTIFWYVAKDGSVRAGKSIPYRLDGHRDKTDMMPASWLHKSHNWDGTHTGTRLQLCYFGEHLLKDNDAALVAVVESEKTAVVLSALVPQWIWLASGGSQMIKNDEKNKALAGRDVLLIPDQGQYWNWKAVALKNKWDIVRDVEWFGNMPGCDILDLVEAGKSRNIKFLNAYEKQNQGI